MTIIIGNKLHEGGEGAIYEIVNDSSRVVKIYHEHKRNKERFKKLKIMIGNPPKNPTAKYNHISFTWPEMLCLENDKPVGYIMPRISNMEPILKLMSKRGVEEFIDKHHIPSNLSFVFLLRVACNVCNVVASIHKQGYVIGDLNEQNVLVNGQGLVTIVDTDSFQVKDPETPKTYPCPVGKTEYTHPEILRELTQNKKSFSDIIQYPYHDDYGLAVIIFRLLVNGCYPYAGTPPTKKDVSIEERIMNGIFPFSGEPMGWKPPEIFEELYKDRISEDLHQLFRAAFVKTAREPSACPSAEQFARALERMEKQYRNASRKWIFISLLLLLSGILYYHAQKNKNEEYYSNQTVQYQKPLSNADKNATLSMKSSSIWKIYNSSNSPLPYDGLSSIVADENDQIWLGTFGGGLARLRNGKWTIYNSGNSDLPNDRIYCLTKASDGTLWIGTFGGGLAQFDGEEWRVYNTSNSPLPHDKVLCLAVSEDGTLWIGTAGGLARKQGEEWFVYTSENSSLPNNEVKSLLLTSDGAVWVGTAKGLACLKGGEWSLYTAETVSWPSYDIQALASNRKGEIWIGTWGGGLIRLKNESWKVYNITNSALPQDYIVTLAFDSKGVLWIGTREKGLACYRDGEWKLYRTFNSELPDNHVYALAIDSRQNVWAGTWKGVACLRREAR